MAGTFSNYLEDKILDHVAGKTSFTMPTVYLALCTVTITDSMTGSTITEANYTGYARKQLAGSDFSASSGGTITNSAQITFAECSSGSSTIVGVAACDSSGAGTGNMLWYSDITSTTINTSNTPPIISIGALVLTAT